MSCGCWGWRGVCVVFVYCKRSDGSGEYHSGRGDDGDQDWTGAFRRRPSGSLSIWLRICHMLSVADCAVRVPFLRSLICGKEPE